MSSSPKKQVTDLSNNKDLGYINGYMGEGDKARDVIDIQIPGIGYSMPVVTLDPEQGLAFPWLPRDGDAVMKYQDILLQTIPDDAASKFKYNLEKNPTLSFFEDPTFLSYDLVFEIDGSPLFDINHTDGAFSFLDKYKNMSEVQNRMSIWDTFIEKVFDIFQSSSGRYPLSDLDTDAKVYYAESISGLEKLNAKITKYGEDKITITLTEDVSMTALYLAELYNNLVYSYKSQKYILPDNCVRFDMLIKISDMRDFKIPNPNYGREISNPDNMGPGVADLNLERISRTKSEIIYRLHDCNFDFFNSMNIGNDLTIGGFNASLDLNPAKLTFDIYYKSVSREMNANLIKYSKKLRNKMIDLSEPIAPDSALFAPPLNVEIEQEQNKKRNAVWSQLGNNLQNRFKEVRGEMLSELVSAVKSKYGILVHQPRNIYEDDVFEQALDFVKDLLSKNGLSSRPPEKNSEVQSGKEIRWNPEDSNVDVYRDDLGPPGIRSLNTLKTNSVGRREKEREKEPVDIDEIPPSDLDPNFHHLRNHPSNLYEPGQEPVPPIGG